MWYYYIIYNLFECKQRVENYGGGGDNGKGLRGRIYAVVLYSHCLGKVLIVNLWISCVCVVFIISHPFWIWEVRSAHLGKRGGFVWYFIHFIWVDVGCLIYKEMNKCPKVLPRFKKLATWGYPISLLPYWTVYRVRVGDSLIEKLGGNKVLLNN